MSNPTICILGGTNVAHALARSSHITSTTTLETPFGPSPAIHHGVTEGAPFYHIALHGVSTAESGTAVAESTTLLRTWSALHQLGVTDILGGATAGSINPTYRQGDWVIADDFIDLNMDRKRSIASDILGPEGNRILARYVPAIDPVLNQILFEETQRFATHVQTHLGGVIAQAAGGRFETVAEVKMYQKLGADLVTLNVPTEMAYARQLNMNFASLIGISNPAEGLGSWDWSTLTNLYPQFHTQSISIYLAAVRRIHSLPVRRRVGDSLRLHPEFD
jgi:5'-methylthioadenosine phosphorylase